MPPVSTTLPDFSGLLASTVKVMTEHRVQHRVTDWPFANFWGSPSEPRHSKLFGWFINPAVEHGCGAFLLGSLVRFLQDHDDLPRDRSFPLEGSRVLAENGYMDLRVEQPRAEGKFVLLFENKIKGAADQKLQLSYYARQLRDLGFDPKDIFVLYAPLYEREPAADDRAALKELGVQWLRVTPFSTCILRWLESVLGSDAAMMDGAARLGHLTPVMIENLSHYRNLLLFLSQQKRTERMNHDILNQLRRAETLPTIGEIDTLRGVLMTVWRARLFLRAQTLLREKGAEAPFFDDKGREIFPALASEFDERFRSEVNLGLDAGDAVRVCYGGFQENNPGSNFWTGYMRAGENPAEQARLEPVVAAASGYAKPNANPPWYVWEFTKTVHHGNCAEESSATHVADTLLEMRQRLLGHDV